MYGWFWGEHGMYILNGLRLIEADDPLSLVWVFLVSLAVWRSVAHVALVPVWHAGLFASIQPHIPASFPLADEHWTSEM